MRVRSRSGTFANSWANVRYLFPCPRFVLGVDQLISRDSAGSVAGGVCVDTAAPDSSVSEVYQNPVCRSPCSLRVFVAVESGRTHCDANSLAPCGKAFGLP